MSSRHTNPRLARNEKNGGFDVKNPSLPYAWYCLRRDFLTSPGPFLVWRHRRNHIAPATNPRLARNEENGSNSSPARNEAGFSLIELMMALAISLPILAGTFSFFSTSFSDDASFGSKLNENLNLETLAQGVRSFYETRIPNHYSGRGKGPSLGTMNGMDPWALKLKMARAKATGIEEVTYQTVCRPASKAALGAVNSAKKIADGHGATSAKLELGNLLSDSIHSTCKLVSSVPSCGEKARTMIEFRRKDVGTSKTVVTYFPGENGGNHDAIAGAVCVRRPSAGDVEILVSFQQALITNGRVVVNQKSLLLPLIEEDMNGVSTNPNILYLQ